MSSPQTPLALLLDLDNTAYAYAPCHRAGLERGRTVARHVDGSWADAACFTDDYGAARQRVKARIGPRAAAHSRLLYFQAMIERRQRRSSPVLALRIAQAYWDGYFAAMHRDEGCIEALAELRRRGIGTAWVTSFTTERQVLKLEALGLADAVDFLVTSEEAGIEKPDGRLVDLAIEKLAVDPRRVWLVGDHLVQDLEMARSRSLPFVWRQRPGDEPGTAANFVMATMASWYDLRSLLDEP